MMDKLKSLLREYEECEISIMLSSSIDDHYVELLAQEEKVWTQILFEVEQIGLQRVVCSHRN